MIVIPDRDQQDYSYDLASSQYGRMHLQRPLMHTGQACMALTMQPRDSPRSPAPRPKIRNTQEIQATALGASSIIRSIEHGKVLTRQSWCCTIGLVRLNVREERQLECRRGGDAMWQSRKEYTPGLLIKAAVDRRCDGMLSASVLLIYQSGQKSPLRVQHDRACSPPFATLVRMLLDQCSLPRYVVRVQ